MQRIGKIGHLSWLTASLVLFLGAIAGGPLEGQVVINEILADNGVSLPDDDGDFADWIELFNPGATEISLLDYSLTDDVSAPRKWVFPDVSIPSGSYLLVWLSGKNRFRPAEDAAQANPNAFRPSLIALGSDWRYLVADPVATGPPAAWKSPGFDETTWIVGRTGLGYGDGDDATELPVDTPAVFLRKTFRIDAAASIASLVLRMDFDDGFVAFLNGTRVAAEGAAEGDPTFQSVATIKREAGSPVLYDLGSHLASLRNGENVLAVVGLNNIPSTDMSILPELGAIPAFLHSSFKLERSGEQLQLLDPLGRSVDSVTFPTQTRDHSYGRIPGTNEWRYFLTPTPEAANTGSYFEQPIPDQISFSPEGGRRPGPIQVQIHLDPPGLGEVRYTLDGTQPTAQSQLFAQPIVLGANTVVTAAGFLDGARITQPTASSYFFGGAIALPVISISMEPADYATVHNSEGARGRGSERAAFLEYFDAGFLPGVAVPCGLRLHGGAGRGGDFETKKSYKCYFRGSYGARRLDTAIIPSTFVDSFDKLVLRAGFNDAFRTNGRAAYIRDQLVRDLEEEMGGVASHGTWCMLYVNMKLRGLYNITERIDDEFLEPYTGEKNWDVIKTGDEVLAGTRDEWDRVRNFCVQNDLSQEPLYRQAEGLIDIPDFTAYMLLNIWAQNHDWISNNWYAARPSRPNGKWIFLCWDAEFGIGLIPSGSSADTFEFVFERSGYLRDIFEGLLKSPIYRAYFAEEADRHAYGSLLPARVLARIDTLKARVSADIPEELAPYGQPTSQWTANVEEMKSFVRSRNASFLGSISRSTRFSFPAVTTPRITTCDPPTIVNLGGAQIVLNGARLGETTRIAFNGIPAERVERLAFNRIRVTLPFDLRLEGPIGITAMDPTTSSASLTEGLLQVSLPRPLPTEIVPARGSSLGGEIVRIAGAGFLPGTTVSFNGTPSDSVTIVDGSPQALEVLTPPGLGVVDVIVENHVAGGAVPARVNLSFTYLAGSLLRADVNADAKVDISDSIALLDHLFLGGATLGCRDAADSDDSGLIDLSDAVYTLLFLFQGGAAPPPPFPVCGSDSTPDDLGCEHLPSCAA